jgi:hypothetical protein
MMAAMLCTAVWLMGCLLGSMSNNRRSHRVLLSGLLIDQLSQAGSSCCGSQGQRSFAFSCCTAFLSAVYSTLSMDWWRVGGWAG